MVKYTKQKKYSDKTKMKEHKLTCVCEKKIDVKIVGRYESLLVFCDYCNMEVEFTKSEVDES